MMDHTGVGRITYDPSALDGSSCATMADSLREILEKDFDAVLGVHFDTMTREDFRKSVDANWRWLDGRPLI